MKGWIRYGLWLGVVGTALANRRYFSLGTTWLPHLSANTAALLLPEIYRLLDRLVGLEARLQPDAYLTPAALRMSFEQLVVDNPDYVEYVAPVALAYIVSHPKFNIYKGKLAEIRFLGFGLDSIPHSLTAYALSNMTLDGLDSLAQNTPQKATIHPYVQVIARHKTLISGLVLAALTLLYESGEYSIHRYEEKVTGGDVNKMNMMWGFKDTFFDILSNTLGWLLAVLRR